MAVRRGSYPEREDTDVIDDVILQGSHSASDRTGRQAHLAADPAPAGAYLPKSVDGGG